MVNGEVIVRDVNIVKYRKLLYKLQFFCKQKKSYLYKDFIFPKKRLTDFERGYINGKHAAYNDVLRKVDKMSQYAECDWESVHCREERCENL